MVINKQQNSNNLRVTKANTLYQLTLFNSKGLSVNCYLVEENECLTLIDTAMAEHAEAIMKVAEQIEKPLTKIILTHAHHDHVGGLDRMKQLLPDSIVYMSGREARMIEGDLQLSEDEPNTPIRGIFPKNIITKADVLLQEGDRIGSLLAMFTPGHTPGSMSFLDTRNNALIVGDAFQTEGGIAVSGVVRPSFSFPALATWNK